MIKNLKKLRLRIGVANLINKLGYVKLFIELKTVN